jgi:hypothetical protein
MFKAIVAGEGERRVIAVDSITQLTPEDADAIVVSGSHGGSSSGEIALEIPLRAVFFNDAGIGKDSAGIAALEMLQARGVAAGTVAHTSGRIGDAQDIWEHGVISCVNAAARDLGCAPGMSLQVALAALISL